MELNYAAKPTAEGYEKLAKVVSPAIQALLN